MGIHPPRGRREFVAASSVIEELQGPSLLALRLSLFVLLLSFILRPSLFDIRHFQPPLCLPEVCVVFPERLRGYFPSFTDRTVVDLALHIRRNGGEESTQAIQLSRTYLIDKKELDITCMIPSSGLLLGLASLLHP
jgi:hypothetical protein